MAHHGCGCFPTGQHYPGIATLQGIGPAPVLGLAAEIDGNRPLHELPLALIDTETTGKDATRGDRVIEIAVVQYDMGKVVQRYSLVVDPGVSIPAEASAVHGIYDADVKGKPRWDAVVETVCGWLEGRIPVAYNASFDRSFIYAEMRRAGTAPGGSPSLPAALRTNVEWIDPLVWARIHQPEVRGYKLGDVAARLDVALVNAHRATDDAEAAGEVLLAILRGQGAPTYRDAIRRQREAAAKMWKGRR